MRPRVEPEEETSLRIDVTTTSVGRLLIRDTYDSFFAHATFTGRFDVIVVIDPTYGVGAEEIDETVRYLQALRSIEPRVSSVTIERLPKNIGLQRALLLLFSHCRNRFGVHLEDDWRFFGRVDLDELLGDLVDRDATMIAFNSTHVSRGGTFQRAGEVTAVPGTRVPLYQLHDPSWASNYLPLCPHLHQTSRWLPAYTRALMLADEPERCPDERVKEYVRANGLAASHPVLWTQQVVVEDIGRDWLARRALVKDIAADEDRTAVRLTDGTDELRLGRSHSYLARARAVIPGETQTFMKRPLNFAPGAFPVYLDRGQGAYVWDVDGNAYVDFIAGLGACSLGYAPPLVTAAVRSQLTKGVLMSLPTLVEVEASEAVVATLPFVDDVRFVKTGADACSAAVRLARWLTGRTVIASAGYHGAHDLFMHGTPGVPADLDAQIVECRWAPEDDPSSFERTIAEKGERLAAVIIALPYDDVVPRARLHVIARAAREAGALFILDEVVTGFRLSATGAAGYYDLEPDVVCLGKSLAAGMPLAAVAGPRRVMEPFAELHVSTTYGGEALSLAVAIAALAYYRSTDYVERIARLGADFAQRVNDAAVRRGLAPPVRGYAPIPLFRFHPEQALHDELGRRFQAECARRGVLLRRDVNFITGAHTQADIDYAVDAVGAALDALGAAARAGV